MTEAQPSIGRGATLTKDDYRTPAGLFDRLNRAYRFNLDPAPYPRPPAYDGLTAEWSGPDGANGRAFVNPPYGKLTPIFLEKALREIQAGRCDLAVFLIFARTDTKWFHRLVLPAAQEIVFLEGRLTFEGADGSSPFPSLLAIFHRDPPSNKPRIFGLSPTAKERGL